MFFSQSFAVALMASTLGTLASNVITVDPGDAGDIIITKENTINATTPAPANGTALDADNATASIFEAFRSNGRLPLSLVNNFAGGPVNAYVTGLDDRNRLVMLKPDGRFYYPDADRSVTTPKIVPVNTAIPLGTRGSTKRITIPGYISSARIWFAEGNLKFYTVYNEVTGAPSLVEPSAVNPADPSAGVNWGFVELTNNQDGGLYANISYVDFVGLVLGMKLRSADGSIQQAKGLRRNAVSLICSELKLQSAKDGQPWGNLCMARENGQPLRVLAPIDYVASMPDAFRNYWDNYIDMVWKRYQNRPLIIDTQAAAGEVRCRVSRGKLRCRGDNRGYAKPSTSDIFGCNGGPFAILDNDNPVHRAVVPRLCAAFNRGTLLKRGGHIQPSLTADHYYTSSPCNWYSKFVHQYEIDGKGYAFSYDDVNPAVGVDQAGVVAHPDPVLLTVTVGGP